MTTMTAEEKKLIQAQHRLEEAQMRAKEKARKARTRRLIQEGAILEKVLPEVQAVGLSELEEYLTAQHVCNVCACITYPNPPSIAFHEKHGYKTVAHFHASGYKQDAWHDMIWMEKTLCPAAAAASRQCHSTCECAAVIICADGRTQPRVCL